MKPRLFLIFFICLVHKFTVAQNNFTSVKDSLLFEKSLKDLKNAIDINDNIKKAEALYELGLIAKATSNIKALDYFNQASSILEKTEHEILKSIFYEESIIHTLFSEFPTALKLGLKSLEINKLNSETKNSLRDMSHIGYIYDRMYDYKESIKWNTEALKIAKKINDKRGEALCYSRIGIAFDELAEKDNYNTQLFDSALYYNKNSAKLSEQLNNLSQARTSYSNIGNTYCKLKDYKKAEEYTLKSLNVPGFEERKGVTLVNLGKIYLETGRYIKAKKVLDSALNNTIKYGTRKYQLEAYYRLHELDVKKGDYKNALNNYIQYKSIEDSLLNETKTKQIAEVSERYKTAEKERQISIQRAELAEQDLIIQERNFQLYGLLAIGLILGVIAYLFFNQQKLKNRQLQKENELKDALLKIETQNRLQEQRLRISRDLHDNIGAQLTFIISSLDNLKYGFQLSEKLNDKLNIISEFTTTTIYELRDTIWAMNKSEITLIDLQSRISNFIDKANIASEDITFKFEIDDSISNTLGFSSVEGMNLYRIIQEAIHNALKYAKPKAIVVLIKLKQKCLEISVEDDGNGFDINNVKQGNGLNNMKKRASEINSELKIQSNFNQGTIITITYPL
jgi:signal transduction histidine kinase